MTDELKTAMRAGAYAIINAKRNQFISGIYAERDDNDNLVNKMSFKEAAKVLMCVGRGINPEGTEIEID